MTPDTIFGGISADVQFWRVAPQQFVYQNLLTSTLTPAFTRRETVTSQPFRRPSTPTFDPPNLVLTAVTAAPFAQYDWLLPTRRRQSPAFDQSTAILGVAGVAIPFAQYDWPIRRRGYSFNFPVREANAVPTRTVRAFLWVIE